MSDRSFLIQTPTIIENIFAHITNLNLGRVLEHEQTFETLHSLEK